MAALTFYSDEWGLSVKLTIVILATLNVISIVDVQAVELTVSSVTTVTTPGIP